MTSACVGMDEAVKEDPDCRVVNVVPSDRSALAEVASVGAVISFVAFMSLFVGPTVLDLVGGEEDLSDIDTVSCSDVVIVGSVL